MYLGNLLISLLALNTWVAAADGIIIVTGTAVAAAAFAALKGAAFIKLAGGLTHSDVKHHLHKKEHVALRHHIHSRSLEGELQETENVLLSSVQYLDPSGCVLKLLCQLEAENRNNRTFEENILLELFSNNPETMSVFNAAFVGAAIIGGRTRDAAVCDITFPRCPLDDAQLRSLLQKAWGCGFDLMGEQMNSA
ncbi:hypothetical protein SK128_010375 [Halocaridina rubra]|uniref:Uncharacterized protein n=1 Tax=Halocaridina rubra TaxID=373956 RepID=A0AAN8WIR3_HALRR